MTKDYYDLDATIGEFVLNKEELADMSIYDELPCDMDLDVPTMDELATPTVSDTGVDGDECIVPQSAVLSDRPSDLYPAIFGNFEDLTVKASDQVPCNWNGVVTPSKTPKLVEFAINDLVLAQSPFHGCLRELPERTDIKDAILKVTAPKPKDIPLSELGPLLQELKDAVASLDKRLAKLEMRYGTLPL